MVIELVEIGVGVRRKWSDSKEMRPESDWLRRSLGVVVTSKANPLRVFGLFTFQSSLKLGAWLGLVG